ncbi:MAG: FKBP-type peptidyl-prolyl cis-trans isomerase [Candidatus Helarchaeales archaeon]
MPAKVGDMVKVNYTGLLDDGTIFDSTEGRAPLRFKIGENQIIKGFEDAVIGMEVGEEKKIKLTPDQAYGDRDQGLIRKFKRELFPDDIEKGMIVVLTSNVGEKIPATVDKVEDESVFLDLNHPLAGKSLTFTIKLLEIA